MKADGTWEKLGFLDARGREFFDGITAKGDVTYPAFLDIYCC